MMWEPLIFPQTFTYSCQVAAHPYTLLNTKDIVEKLQRKCCCAHDALAYSVVVSSGLFLSDCRSARFWYSGKFILVQLFAHLAASHSSSM